MWEPRAGTGGGDPFQVLPIKAVATVYLTDYAEEFKRVGEVVFRRRHPSPVLIVSGKAAELVESRSSREITMVARPATEQVKDMALMHRVFPIVKAAYSPRGPVLLGRTADNDVAIPEYSISKRHCFFEFQPGKLFVTDCGSTNGTIVNGQRLEPKQPTLMNPGDTITLGRYAFMYQSAPAFLDYVQTVGARDA
jgi:hypothetical protein